MSEQKKSWRDVYKVHPAADIFPMLPEEELRKLGEDIKEHGLREPITLYRADDDTDAKAICLVDGRNRLAAMELVGLINTVVRYIHSDPEAYIISKNIRRRHLTKEQQADLIVKVMKASTDVAKLARSVKRDSSGRLHGSAKDPVKEKTIAVAKEHGLSKRTIERSIAKVNGPTQSPRGKKPPKVDYKAIVRTGEERKLQQDIESGWVTPDQARNIANDIAKAYPTREKAMDERRTGEQEYRRKIADARAQNPEVPGRPKAWLLGGAINRIGIAINAEMNRAPDIKERYALALEIRRLGFKLMDENRKNKRKPR